MKFQGVLFVSILVIFRPSIALSQGSWDWRDPLDTRLIDLGNKYLLGFNLAGMALSLLAFKGNEPKITSPSFSFYTEYHHEFLDRPPLSHVFTIKSRIEYPLREWIGFGGELQAYKMRDPLGESIGFGSAIFFTWSVLRSVRWKLSFDNGFGMLWTTNNFPNEGTQFNFSTFYGVSFDYAITEEVAVQVGVRNMHISNAYLFGENRNPAFNSIGFLIGLRFRHVLAATTKPSIKM